MEIPEFVEIEFSIPFFDIYFNEEWDALNFPKNPVELKNICQAIDICLETNYLYEEYCKTPIQKGDLYFFFSKNSKDVFLFFDLFKPADDQMAMKRLGMRIPLNILPKIRKKVMKLYLKSRPRTAIQEDYFNGKLLKIASGNYQQMDREIKYFQNKN